MKTEEKTKKPDNEVQKKGFLRKSILNDIYYSFIMA